MRSLNIFRALNILKKDILDVDHDKMNNIDTVAVLIKEKSEINFKDYITDLTEHILMEEKELTNKPGNNKTQNKTSYDVLMKKIKKMNQDQRKEILTLIN